MPGFNEEAAKVRPLNGYVVEGRHVGDALDTGEAEGLKAREVEAREGGEQMGADVAVEMVGGKIEVDEGVGAVLEEGRKVMRVEGGGGKSDAGQIVEIEVLEVRRGAARELADGRVNTYKRGRRAEDGEVTEARPCADGGGEIVGANIKPGIEDASGVYFLAAAKGFDDGKGDIAAIE